MSVASDNGHLQVESNESETYETDPVLQIKILSLLVNSPSAIIEFKSVIRPDYFDEDHLEYICRTLYEFHGKYGESPSHDEITDYLENHGSDQYDGEMIDEIVHHIYYNDFGDLEYAKEKAEEFAKEQSMKNAIRKSAVHLENGEYDLIRREMEDALAVGQDKSQEEVMFFDEFGEYLEREMEREKSRQRLSTGMANLDVKMDSGLPTGKVAIVQAPTNRGKSMWLIHTAVCYLAQGYDVAHYTIEDSAIDTGIKYFARMDATPIRDVKIKRGDLNQLGNDLDQLGDQYEGNLHLAKLPYRKTAYDVHSRLARLYSRKDFSPDVIIIDYMDDMTSSKGDSSDRYEDQGEIVVDLKDISERHEAGIWTATQSNRDSLTSATVQLQHGSDSIMKFQKADFVGSLSQNGREEEEGKMRFVCNKSKISDNGWAIPVETNTDQQLFTELEE